MLTPRRPLAAALALALGAPLAAAAAQNVVQNPGFEAPAIVGSATLSGCPAAFVWCIGQGNIDLVDASIWQPGDGRQSIDLNGTDAGSVYQDLATTAGQTYDLTFLPEYSKVVVEKFVEHGLNAEFRVLPCGHYTTGETPFKFMDGWHIGKFLKTNL